MRHYVDSGILLGKVLVDDDFHDHSTTLFSGFHHGELRIVQHVIFDIESLVLQEANAIAAYFQKMCPLGALAKLGRSEAKDKVRSTFARMKRQERMKHAGIKDEVRDALYKAIDEGTIVQAVRSIPMMLPRRLHDLIEGCLGNEVLGAMDGLAGNDSEEILKTSIEQELLLHKGKFGARDDNDRRILGGLILECHRKQSMTFLYL